MSAWKPGKTDDIPNVWLLPKHSVILEVKAPELVKTDQFAAGLTPRFPRVERIRWGQGNDEKPWHEAMTLKDVQEVNARRESGKSNKRTADMVRQVLGRV
jgi:DNA ligase-4